MNLHQCEKNTLFPKTPFLLSFFESDIQHEVWWQLSSAFIFLSLITGNIWF